MPQYRIDGSVVGEPTFDQQFRWQQEAAERIDRRNSRLQQFVPKPEVDCVWPAHESTGAGGLLTDEGLRGARPLAGSVSV